MDAVQEIKDKLSIEDVVTQYVQLKKAGVNYKGLCPWHAEKTPSFMVSPEKQIAYCFSCHKGGDVFTFIQEIEGVEFNEALKILADKAGIQLPQAGEQKTFATGDTKQRLFDICNQVTGFYQKKLLETEQGKKVLEYLINRGLTNQSIESFKVGYSPDSFDETYSYLLNKGFSRKEIVGAGLAVPKDTSIERIYDRFRGRLMFPISDSSGRIVAFGGRALSKDQEPKYLNSPETAIYHKSRVLYGYSHAKQSIKEKGEVVIVEGYMDVIASAQAGVTNVVAPCGTALGANQIRILKPFINSIIFSFDSDFAGKEAGRRAYEIVKDLELDVKVLELPEGKDPAEYVKNHGTDLQKVVGGAEMYIDYTYKSLLKSYDTNDFSSKKKILHEFIPFFMNLNSNVEKDEMIRRLSMDLDLKEVNIYDEIRNFKLPDYHPARIHTDLEEKNMVPDKLSRTHDELLMGLLIEYPRIGKIYLSKISEIYFTEKIKPIYKVYNDYYNNLGSESADCVLCEFPSELKEMAGLISLYVSETYGEKTESEVEKTILELISRIKKSLMSENRKNIQVKLREAEKAGDKELVTRLLTELSGMNLEFVDNK